MLSPDAHLLALVASIVLAFPDKKPVPNDGTDGGDVVARVGLWETVAEGALGSSDVAIQQERAVSFNDDVTKLSRASKPH